MVLIKHHRHDPLVACFETVYTLAELYAKLTANEDFGNMLSQELHCPCKNDKITVLFVLPLTGIANHLGGLKIKE